MVKSNPSKSFHDLFEDLVELILGNLSVSVAVDSLEKSFEIRWRTCPSLAAGLKNALHFIQLQNSIFVVVVLIEEGSHYFSNFCFSLRHAIIIIE